MKKLVVVATLLSISLYSCDIRKKDKNAEPEIKNKVTYTSSVEVIDSLYDFGTVNEGEMVVYNYKFKNTGKQPLVIYEAVASCGCTVPEKPEQPIKPGDIGIIKVKFNSDKRPGETHKTITVSSNATPEFPVLILKGTVKGKQS